MTRHAKKERAAARRLAAFKHRIETEPGALMEYLRSLVRQGYLTQAEIAVCQRQLKEATTTAESEEVQRRFVLGIMERVQANSRHKEGAR